MADTPEATGVETSAQRQARIRKEKREAKIKSGGSARLNKIIGLGGGLQRDEPQAPPAPSTADPEEVDISNHYYEPQSRKHLPRNDDSSPSRSQSQQQLNDDQLRQMMLGMNTSPAGPGQTPFGPAAGGFPGTGMGGQDASGGDPMMQLLQQMMGGAGGPSGEGNGLPSFPGMPGMNMQDQAQAATVNPYAYLWRIIHAIFALSLGLYIAFTTPFSGTKYEREAGVLEGLSTVKFFYVFASVEVLLLSSRFFLEMGKETGNGEGWVGMAMGLLPEPWKGYLALGRRYMGIWGTVSGDALVCVWVLGCCAWLRGGE